MLPLDLVHYARSLRPGYRRRSVTWALDLDGPTLIEWRQTEDVPYVRRSGPVSVPRPVDTVDYITGRAGRASTIATWRMPATEVVARTSRWYDRHMITTPTGDRVYGLAALNAQVPAHQRKRAGGAYTQADLVRHALSGTAPRLHAQAVIRRARSERVSNAGAAIIRAGA